MPINKLHPMRFMNNPHVPRIRSKIFAARLLGPQENSHGIPLFSVEKYQFLPFLGVSGRMPLTGNHGKCCKIFNSHYYT